MIPSWGFAVDLMVMAWSTLAFSTLLISCGSALDLTVENWDKETAGKSVFIKFMSPSDAHSINLKPSWKRLMKMWNKDHRESSLIADVDCPNEKSKALCGEAGVKNVPQVMWGEVRW